MELGQLVHRDDLLTVIKRGKGLRRIPLRHKAGVPGHEPGPGGRRQFLGSGIGAALMERKGLAVVISHSAR